MSSPNGDLWENQWRLLYDETKEKTTDELKAIGQMTIQTIDEINEKRDAQGRLNQTDEIAFEGYSMYLDVITIILLERSVIL